MSVSRPGVGFLGYDFMGRAHANALRVLSYMTGPPMIRPRLVSVAGRNEEGVRQMAERFEFERWTTDWHEVVADPDVQVFENLGPNSLHASASIAAAQAGKAVLCEKPLARDAQEARTMLEAVEAAGAVNMCAFNYRFMPAVRRARDLIDAGHIGDILHFRGTYRQSWGSSSEAVWRFDKDVAGGGALGDLASHVVDIARYLVGEIARVKSAMTTFVPDRTVDDAIAAVVEFENGAIGTIEATRFATGEQNRFTWEINGTTGSLLFDVERLNELWVDGVREQIVPDGWWPPGHGVGWGDSFVFELRHFLEAVDGHGSVAPHGATFADGLRAAEICDDIARGGTK